MRAEMAAAAADTGGVVGTGRGADEPDDDEEPEEEEGERGRLRPPFSFGADDSSLAGAMEGLEDSFSGSESEDESSEESESESELESAEEDESEVLTTEDAFVGASRAAVG